jgi:hypothetical protein
MDIRLKRYDFGSFNGGKVCKTGISSGAFFAIRVMGKYLSTNGLKPRQLVAG